MRYQNDIKMKEKILFSEQQKFRQIWLWVMVLSATGASIGVFLWALIQQVVRGVPFHDKFMSNTELIIAFAFSLGLALVLIILLVKMRLETIITSEGVKIKFFPVHHSYRNFQWEDISEAVVKKYSPMKYGGWGIRFKIYHFTVFHNVTAYNVSGNQALQLHFKNGKKTLIGTQKPYELEVALRKIEQLNK